MKIRIILSIMLMTLSTMVMGQGLYQKNIDKALAGDAGAQLDVGFAYEKGDGVAKDLKEAVSWYRKSANQGNKIAQCNLGYCYESGMGVEKDFFQAFYWYKKSADQGWPRAESCIGFCYEKGMGVAEDKSQAVIWYRKAAEHGFMYGQANLGWCYYKGVGVAQDYKQAFYWNKKAADQGLARAQTWIGVFYEKGIGVEKDYTEMFYWYTKAAEQNDGNALRNVGICYDYERGVSKDPGKALYYYREALAKGGLSQTDAEWTKNRIKTLTSSGYKEKSDYAPQYYASRRRTNTQPTQPVKETPVKQEPVVAQQPVASQQPVQQQPRVAQQSVQQPKPVVPQVVGVDVNIPVTAQLDKNTFAIIIGNEKYEEESDVPFAENDAKIFYEYCKKTLGISEKHIRLYVNAGYNDIRKAVSWLKQGLTAYNGQARVIFYYAGHGIPNEADKGAYLLPVDGVGSDIESAYSLNKLYHALSELPAQRVSVFLDACFSGAKRDGQMMASARGVAIKAKPAEAKGKMVVFTAATGDETAYPFKSQQHGMFTYYLLKKLQETKGDVTLGDLGDYLTNEVRRESFDENSKLQTPTVIPSQAFANSWRNMKLK